MRKRIACLISLVLFIFAGSTFTQGADRGEIKSGETKSGTITAPSFMDTWTFYGNAGDRIIINAVTTSGSLDTYIDLYTPPPNNVKEATTYPWYDQLDVQIKQTGEYTIIVLDYGLNHSGNYNITFLKLPGTVSSPEDPDGGSIASGETLAGTIDVHSDLDVFQFYGQSGEWILINVVKTSGDLDTYLNLYPSGGGAQEASTYPWYDQLNHQLQQTGLYSIVIQDYGLNHSGEYNITLLKIPGAISFPDDLDGGAIASGESFPGSIDVASDIDVFQFYGQTGERVIVNTVKSFGSLDTYMDLLPPDGGPREATTYPWYDQLDHILAKTGLYTIVIQDYGLDHTGDYYISLTKIPSTMSPGIYNPSPSNGSTVTNLNGSFRWDQVSGATGYDFYFGEDVIAPLEKKGNNLSSPSMPFPSMEVAKIYYWYVVAHTSTGDIKGPYWWFQTGENEETYSISGRVTLNSSGLSGVTMTLSGSSSATTTTDASGNYSFTELNNGIYTITPGKSSYTFTPSSRSVTINGANITDQNFTASAVTQGYSISGTVTLIGTKAPLPGVTTILTGAATATTSTDINAFYQFSGLSNGTYTVTPSKSGYRFFLRSRNVTVNGTNVILNFKAKAL